MADYLTTDTELASIANAIRTKGGTSAQLVYPSGFISAIQAISTGIDTSDATAVAGDIVSGKTAYARGSKLTGSIQTKTGSDVTIHGQTVTVPVGYYASEVEKDLTSVTPAFEGGTLSGIGTLEGDSCSISPSTNNSGVSISAECQVSRANVTYDGNVEGWVTEEDGEVALTGTTQTIQTATYYINGVTIEAPSSGTRSFSITVPNGNSTLTFIFTVDSNGDVVVTESGVN